MGVVPVTAPTSTATETQPVVTARELTLPATPLTAPATNPAAITSVASATAVEPARPTTGVLPQQIVSVRAEDVVARNLERLKDTVPLVTTAVLPLQAVVPAECVKAGVPAEKCNDWLAARGQSTLADTCRGAGVLTREECVAFIL